MEVPGGGRRTAYGVLERRRRWRWCLGGGGWEAVFCQLVDGVLFVGGEWDAGRGRPYPLRLPHQLRLKAKPKPPASPRRPFPAQQTYIQIRIGGGGPRLTLRSGSAETTRYWAAALRRAAEPAAGPEPSPPPLPPLAEAPSPQRPAVATPSVDSPASSCAGSRGGATESSQRSSCPTAESAESPTQTEWSAGSERRGPPTAEWSRLELLATSSEAFLLSDRPSIASLS